ncbi:MAG: DUF929 domain-containing protein [Candidatus Marsarchaeota archaeon]|jgi:hypothetical protein|nr:DUF929 domain-containing protein [Candidatus Marsarchaeota archaeon]MCL5111575.1 DUF929 domain-containing protein [Candidatus Marsarchaeota archaeon]
MNTKSSRAKRRRPRAGCIILAAAVAVLVIIALYQRTVITSLSNQNVRLSQQLTTLANRTNSIAQGQHASYPAYDIKSQLPVPPTSLPGYPIITQNGTFGDRLTNLNAPLNSTDLSIINNAPASYFETAGEMLLNGTLNNSVGVSPLKVNNFIVNGKPSVIYYGSITCVWCGENRWAMALALSRFGSFSRLYTGYSSLGDGDVPTLYWRPVEYNASTVNPGSFYNSSYINFLPMEDINPITGGFTLNPFSKVQKILNETGIPAYIDAFNYILQINTFGGTPYTIWGEYVASGADAVDFGNGPPTGSTLPLTGMTHAQVYAQLAHPATQFAWTEYAGADVYVALMCSSIGNNASVCSLPVIPKIESRMGV